MNLNPSSFDDLLSLGFEEVGRCAGLVRRCYRRVGIELAGLDLALADVWQQVERPEPGDLVSMHFNDEPHVAFYLGDNRILHALAGVGVVNTPLDASERSGKVGGFWRHAGFTAIRSPKAEPFDVTVVNVPDLARPLEREVATVRWEPGLTLRSIAPLGATVTVRDGEYWAITDDPVAPGSVILYGRPPGGLDPVTASLIVGVGLSLLGTAIQFLFSPSVGSLKDRQEIAKPSFDLTTLRNTAEVGIAQPVIYGTHRCAGNIISAFQTVDDQDRSVLNLTLFLSRGPIQAISGLTADANDLQGTQIPDTIQIDGSPARNYGALVSVRLGNFQQDPFPALAVSRSSVNYSYTLLTTNQFFHTTTQQVTGFEVLIDYPLGLFNLSNTSGAIGPRYVTLTFEYRRKGTTTWTSSTIVQSNARRGEFAKMYRQMGLTQDYYEIRVTRVAPVWPETAADHESKSVVTNVNEITSDSLSYPGWAMLNVQVVGTDQLSGSIPTITSIVTGRKVWIWDGNSTTSPAFGTDETWTDSPAWCVMDMLINPNYGMNRTGKVPLDRINLTSFLSWATHCATLVNDGRGSTRKRSTMNLLVDTVSPGFDFIAECVSTHHGRLLVAGADIRIVPETTSTAVAVFGQGNAADVQLTYAGRRARVNTVEVQYLNSEANYEADLITLQDATDVAAFGVVKETIQGTGVAVAAEAYHLAQLRLNYHRKVSRRVTFTAGPDSFHLLPGDTFRGHFDASSVGIGGRLLGGSATTVKLDRALTLSVTTAITIRTSDDSVQSYFLGAGTYARNSAITITDQLGSPGPLWSPAPSGGEPYVTGPLNTVTAPKQWRILSASLTPDLRRTITAEEYDATIYTAYAGPVESFTDTMPDPKALPSNAIELTLTDAAILNSDGSVNDACRADWTPSAAWDSMDVFYRIPDWTMPGYGPWQFLSRTTGSSATLPVGGANNSVEVSLVPLSKTGARRSPENGFRKAFNSRGRRERPTDPSGSLLASVVAGMLHVEVTPITDPSVARYQFRYGDTWGAAIPLYESASNVISIPCPFLGSFYIRCRTVSGSGVISANEIYARVTHTFAESIYCQDVSQTAAPGWADTKTNTTVTASELHLSGTNLTGTYQTADYTTFLDAGQQAIVLSATSGMTATARKWDDCLFRWDDAGAATWATMNLDGLEVTPRPARWDDFGSPWDSLPGSCLTWDGPIDVVAALQPKIEFDTNIAGGGFSGSWTQYRGPVEAATLTAVRCRVTLNRPHSNYDPRLTGLATNSLIIGQSEPERISVEYTAGTATGAGARSHGFSGTASANATLKIPTARIGIVTYGELTVTTGATAGTYTVDLIVRNVTNSTDNVILTISTSSTNARVNSSSYFTRATTPLALAAGKEYQVGWFNRATSPGALTNTNHVANLTVVYDRA